MTEKGFTACFISWYGVVKDTPKEADLSRVGEVGVQEEKRDRIFHLHDVATVNQVGGGVKLGVKSVLKERHGETLAAEQVLHVTHT